jgi:hypothetical protein
MIYNEQNWKELLDALHFQECDNSSFGGKCIFNDKGIPEWTYDSNDEECKRNLFMFLTGALYMKHHLGIF